MKWFVLLTALAAGGCTQTTDEMSYTELKQYARQMVERCQKQGIPEAELKACAEQEMRADQSRVLKQRRIAASTTHCQFFGSSMVCF